MPESEEKLDEEKAIECLNAALALQYRSALQYSIAAASLRGLEAQAVGVALASAAANWRRGLERAGARSLAALLGEYLCPRHRDDLGKGCPLPALGADVGRQGERARAAFTAGLRPILELLSNVVHGRSKAERRRKAIATMAEMIGALILARAVDDPALSDEILTATLLDLSEPSESSCAAKRLSPCQNRPELSK